MHELRLTIRGPKKPVSDKAAAAILDEFTNEVLAKRGWTVTASSSQAIGTSLSDLAPGPFVHTDVPHRLSWTAKSTEPISDKIAAEFLAEVIAQAKQSGWSVEVATVTNLEDGDRTVIANLAAVGSPAIPITVMNSALVQVLFATMAAQAHAADALTRGDAAAKALLDNGDWDLIQHAVYLAKTPAERLLFWQSNQALIDLQEAAAKRDAIFPDLVPLVEQARLLFLQEYADQIQKGQIVPPTTPSTGTGTGNTGSGTGPSSADSSSGLGTVIAFAALALGGVFILPRFFGGR